VTDVAQGQSITLAVHGMDCSSCAETVHKALRTLEGVEDVRTDVVAGRVTVTHSGSLAPAAVAAAVTRLGYPARDVGPREGYPARDAGPPLEARPHGPHAAVAGAWKRNARLHFALLSGIAWAAALAADHLLHRDALAAALAVGAIVAGGRYIVPRGVRAALNRALDMNFLMTVAALGALMIGEYGEAATAMFLFAVAQLLESHSMDRARNAIRGLMELAPATAAVLRQGREERVPAEQVRVGETVVIRPGEKIAVDGVVVAGRSGVDQAPITGESVPVDKEPGMDVYAGTMNGEGVLEVRSTKAASDTTLARIIHSVETAQASRAPTQAFVDRFARVYTPAVVMTAIAVMLLPPLFGGLWSEWFYRALVLLVVACPCALVISTPVTIVSALTGAARRGILIKGGLHLENAGRVRVVAMDKTGTLTEGRPEVVAVLGVNGVHSSDVLRYAAAAQARSEHPLARAVIRHAEAEGVAFAAAADTTALPGRGVRADVAGTTVHVGSERLFAGLGMTEVHMRELLDGFASQGRTAMLVGTSTPGGNDASRSEVIDVIGVIEVIEVIGIIAVADRLRAEAGEALEDLHAAGIRRVVMLTGDNHGTAAAVATALAGQGRGVDEFHSELLPDDKVAAVRRLMQEHGPVMFVGDGVNDAPALAVADVGVAMGSAGTDVALETADIALMGDDLARLATTIRLARKAERIIRANIAFALLTKAVFVVLALLGVATLWMAVFADMGTSLIVVMNGLRALRES
jgi:Zn2+/Cd2+-exporting ATPase